MRKLKDDSAENHKLKVCRIVESLLYSLEY